jgi:putative endonuclease
MYIVYIIRCSDDTFYTWITTELERRVKQHNGELVWWAKYTRSRWPVEVVYSEVFENRSDATKREYEIKKLPRNQKIDLIGNSL